MDSMIPYRAWEVRSTALSSPSSCSHLGLNLNWPLAPVPSPAQCQCPQDNSLIIHVAEGGPRLDAVGVEDHHELPVPLVHHQPGHSAAEPDTDGGAVTLDVGLASKLITSDSGKLL